MTTANPSSILAALVPVAADEPAVRETLANAMAEIVHGLETLDKRPDYELRQIGYVVGSPRFAIERKIDELRLIRDEADRRMTELLSVIDDLDTLRSLKDLDAMRRLWLRLFDACTNRALTEPTLGDYVPGELADFLKQEGI